MKHQRQVLFEEKKIESKSLNQINRNRDVCASLYQPDKEAKLGGSTIQGETRHHYRLMEKCYVTYQRYRMTNQELL